MRTYGQSECSVCGHSFLKLSSNSKTCSSSCRVERNRVAALSSYYKDVEENRNKAKERAKTNRNSNPLKFMLKDAKRRAKAKGIRFNLTEDDLTIPDLCPLLGKPLERFTAYAPSIDRIDSTKGYTKDNVWVISKRANQIKNDATIEELELILEGLKKHEK